MWIPSYIGIHGNERPTGQLNPPLTHIYIYISIYYIYFPYYLGPILPPSCTVTFSTFGLTRYWNKLSAKYKNAVPNIPNKITWFNNLNLPRSTIVRFNQLRVGHSLLPDHANKLGLKDSPLCTLHLAKSVFDLQHLLNTNPEIIINKLTIFILEAGFAIQQYIFSFLLLYYLLYCKIVFR